MKLYARRFAVLLPLLLLLAACGSSDQRRTARLLNERLQTQLAPEIAANRAALQSLPDGARVTLLDPSLFPNGLDVLDNRASDSRASVIQGLLDPSLMRIQVADTSALPDDQRDARVRNVVQYFATNGLASALRPVDQPPGSAAVSPAGLAITISVACPHRGDGAGYGTGEAKPACY
jgi:hypothetical protein